MAVKPQLAKLPNITPKTAYFSKLESPFLMDLAPMRSKNRQLYLAIPLDAYETFFQSRFAQVSIDRYQLKLIVYEPIAEEIIQWIN